MDISGVDPRVSVILDIKTPGSGEMEKNRWQNLEHIKPRDEIKFVLCNREDYNWARKIMAEHNLADKCSVLFRSEEHTSELQSLMRISYAVFCLKKKKIIN